MRACLEDKKNASEVSAVVRGRAGKDDCWVSWVRKMVMESESIGDTVPGGSGSGEVWLHSHLQPREYVHQIIVAYVVQDAFCKTLNGLKYRIPVLIRDAEADDTDDVGY